MYLPPAPPAHGGGKQSTHYAQSFRNVNSIYPYHWPGARECTYMYCKATVVRPAELLHWGGLVIKCWLTGSAGRTGNTSYWGSALPKKWHTITMLCLSKWHKPLSKKMNFQNPCTKGGRNSQTRIPDKNVNVKFKSHKKIKIFLRKIQVFTF